MSYVFVCPKCGGTDLHVECKVECKVLQSNNGEFETEPLNSTEWHFDRNSFMSCEACYYASTVKDFEVPAKHPRPICQVFGYPVGDWKYAVKHGETVLNYEEWVSEQQIKNQLNKEQDND